MQTEITVIRSNRKTLAIQVKPDMTVTVRAPKRASSRDIERFVQEKEPWIRKQLGRLQAENQVMADEGLGQLSIEEVKDLADKAVKYIPDRVEYFAGLMGVSYGRITIRNQKTRWGSCSSKGNLNFNCLLMLAPQAVIDYVVVHELCHLLEPNHSKAFWAEVEKVMPEYRDYEKWLKTEGRLIMRRNV